MDPVSCQQPVALATDSSPLDNPHLSPSDCFDWVEPAVQFSPQALKEGDTRLRESDG